MTRYELLLFLHIAAAIIWLGSALLIKVLVFRGEQSGDPVLGAKLAENAEWLAQRLFIPASLSVFVLGVILTLDSPAWSFDQLWILIGIAGYAASFLTGVLFIRTQGMRIGELAGSLGPTHPDVRFLIKRLEAVTWMELVILFLVVADMAVKPTTDDVGTLLVGAAIVALTLAVGFRSIRRAGSAAQPAG
jgi:uncharacterized membrane protein